MIKVSVNVDMESPEICCINRTTAVDTTFPICLMIEHVGDSQYPVVFDTLILEVFFNDDENVLIRVDPDDRPVVADIANHSSSIVDVFSGEALKAGTPFDDPPFSGGTRLSLMQSLDEPAGPFRGRTGRAGIRDTNKPFILFPGDKPISFAMGKVGAGLTATQAGKSSITATGLAFYGSRPVPVLGVRGEIIVQPDQEDSDMEPPNMA